MGRLGCLHCDTRNKKRFTARKGKPLVSATMVPFFLGRQELCLQCINAAISILASDGNLDMVPPVSTKLAKAHWRGHINGSGSNKA
eukprot:1110385-Karenia_brevis.AAC.1